MQFSTKLRINYINLLGQAMTCHRLRDTSTRLRFNMSSDCRLAREKMAGFDDFSPLALRQGQQVNIFEGFATHTELMVAKLSIVVPLWIPACVLLLVALLENGVQRIPMGCCV